METGGRLLDYVGRKFQGKVITGHLDIPIPVRERWQEMAVADRLIRDSKAELAYLEAAPAFNKEHAKLLESKRKRLRRLIDETTKSHRLTTCLDEQFGLYWKSYVERRDELLKEKQERFLMPGGNIETPLDWLTNELRSFVIEAIRRIHGQANGK